VFPNIKGSGLSSERLAEMLVKQASVLTVSGSSFGTCGEGYLRLSYAAAYESLEEALNRIQKVLKNLHKPC
jgi:aminotransferase